MDNQRIRVPSRLSRELLYAIAPLWRDGDELEIVIHLENSPFRVGDFARYLTFVDRAYGRLTEGGLVSYAHRAGQQLTVSDVRVGSAALVLAGQLVAPAVALGLIGVAARLLKTFGTVYRDVQEGRLAGAKRSLVHEEVRLATERRLTLRAKRLRPRELRDALSREPGLTAQMGPETQKQLLHVLGLIYNGSSRDTRSAKRFAEESIMSIDIVVRSLDPKPK